jgi:V8-like Glu-specific endopeptidase
MGLGTFRPAALALAGIAVVGVGFVLSPSVGKATSLHIGSAAYGQTSTVGALFARAASGQLSDHFCTASVVDSPAGDLVITAAHCVAGRTAGQVAFVPDYSRGQRPYGTWTVSRIIEDRQWLSSSSPDDDFAFLIVHKPGTRTAVQELTGGEVLGIDESAGRTVKVAGYPNSQDGLISCQNTALAFSPTQFEFDCAGFTDGTSGSPLLGDVGPFDGVDTVIGVIGGYERGGNTAAVSYAARFSTRMAALYQTALAAASR